MISETTFSEIYAKESGLSHEAAKQTCSRVFGALTSYLSKNEAVHIDGLGTFGQIAGANKKQPMRLNLELEPIEPPVEMVPVTDVIALHANMAKCVSAFGVAGFNQRMTDMISAIEATPIQPKHRSRSPWDKESICVYCGKTYTKKYKSQKYCCQSCAARDHSRIGKAYATQSAEQAARFTEQMTIS